MLPRTLKRITNEIKDLNKNTIDYIQAFPDDNNMLIFYFMLKGEKGSDYDGGYYIGQILLPEDYPMNPGDIMLLTPNGRFEPNHKICLTNTGFHASDWNPLWGIRTILLGIYSIWLTDTEHGISHIRESPKKRQQLAQESHNFNTAMYPEITKKFTQFVNSDGGLLIPQSEPIKKLMSEIPVQPTDIKPKKIRKIPKK